MVLGRSGNWEGMMDLCLARFKDSLLWWLGDIWWREIGEGRLVLYRHPVGLLCLEPMTSCNTHDGNFPYRRSTTYEHDEKLIQPRWWSMHATAD